MRAELEIPSSEPQLIPGEATAVSEEDRLPPGNGGRNPSGGPAALPGAGPGSTPYQEGYYCTPCYQC